MEVRHLQKLFRPLHPADVEDARIFQLLLVPATPRMFDRKETEIELRDELAARFSQFGSDRLSFFKAWNVVATETTVPADETFARVQVLLIGCHLFQFGACFNIGRVVSQLFE